MEKLIRHRLPEVFAAKGETIETREAHPEERLRLLRDKLREEVDELSEAIDARETALAAGQPVLEVERHLVAELADVWEVVETIRDLMGVDRTRAAINEKAWDRGCFYRGIVMKLPDPVALVLHCPSCDGQHVDRGIWSTTRVHRTHLCEHCGHTWKPFEYPTVGIEMVPVPPPLPEGLTLLERTVLSVACPTCNASVNAVCRVRERHVCVERVLLVFPAGVPRE